MVYLIIACGLPALVLPVVALVHTSSPVRALGLVAASYFFIALCLTGVLWFNTVAAVVDHSTLIDTVNGWLFGAVVLMVWTTTLSAATLVRLRRRMGA